MSLKIKFLTLFAILAAVALANLVVLLWAEDRAHEKQAWIEHTHTVIINSSDLLGSLRDAETGQRGFLLTGREQYLDPYYSGVEEAGRVLARLKQLTVDNPAQQVRLERIEPLVAKKFAELKLTIDLFTQDDKAEARAIVQGGDGKQLMDELRDQIGQFDLAEERLLEQRIKAFEEGERNLRILFGLEALSLIIAIFAIGFYIQRNLVDPIGRLTKGTENIANNELWKSIPPAGDDEIGRLTQTFNDMARNIRSRNEAIEDQARLTEAYSQIVTACNSNKDLRETLLEALIIHSINHPSPLGAVYLHSKETGKLHCVISHGAADGIMDSVSTDAGTLAQVFSTNQSLILDANSVEGFDFDAETTKSKPHSIVLNPIRHGQKTLGVLVLAYTVPPAEQDLQYIANLAMQFGITVMNRLQFTALQELSLELSESRRQALAERDQAVLDSFNDSLTGLHNRGYFESRIGQMTNQSIRYDHDLSVVLVDIDFFKRINDNHGHQVGDDVLASTGALLKRETRSSDLVARYGGEEFIIVMPQTSLDEACNAAEKLRKAFEKLDIPALGGEFLTISLGVSILSKDDMDVEKGLIARADKALYEAKKQGRNQVCISGPDDNSRSKNLG